MNYPQLQHTYRTQGFSLMECNFAIVLSAVALTAMLGMLGTFLPVSGESKDKFAIARIYQSLSHDAQMKSWEQVEELESQAPQTKFFSEQADEVDENDFLALYAARVTYSAIDAWPNSDGTVATSTQSASRKVTVQIAPLTGTTTPFENASRITQRSFIITRFDK